MTVLLKLDFSTNASAISSTLIINVFLASQKLHTKVSGASYLIKITQVKPYCEREMSSES